MPKKKVSVTASIDNVALFSIVLGQLISKYSIYCLNLSYYFICLLESRFCEFLELL